MTPFITTFYSFKGGVGRSSLLANVGARLALQGYKVLLWDLDLEAPGLHHFPGLTPKPLPKSGFLEWLQDWQAAGSPLPIPKAKQKTLCKTVRPCTAAPGLEILPAYGDKADFARLYQAIHWNALLVEEPAIGLDLFRGLLQTLAEAGGYHHILLDARTGITDLGGLMAALLPDATVLVGSYALQSSAGLLHVHSALQPAVEGKLAERERPLERLLVASPVPLAESNARQLRAESWGQTFAGLGETITWTEIPFHAPLLFSEELLVVSEPTAPIALRYAALADKLQGLRDAHQAETLAFVEAMAYHDLGKTNRRFQELTAGQRGKTFEERIAHLLALLDYQVEREQLIGANRVDLLAKKRAGFKEECYLVECKNQAKPTPKADLEKFKTWLDDPKARELNAQGMFVAHAYAPAALTYAKGQNILALTPAELENALFDFRPYLERLVREFENSALAKTYVEQRVLLENAPAAPSFPSIHPSTSSGRTDGKERQSAVRPKSVEGLSSVRPEPVEGPSVRPEPVEGRTEDDSKPPLLLPHAQAWAAGAGKRLWLLLGDYGSGKSAFFQRFAYALAQQALADREAPIPLAVDLKRFPNAISLEALLQEHLRETLNWHGNPAIFLHLLQAGRIVLLLDAFDEMGTAAVGRSVEEQFRQLARPAAQAGDGPRGNRVFITCRTHFFRDQQQAKRAADGAVHDSLVSQDSPLAKVARSFDASLDELPLFDDGQIDEFLRRRLGEAKAAEARTFIDATYDLPSLAERPVMLDMIVSSLPALMAEGGNVTPAGLYYRYTHLWLRDFSGGNLQTSPDLRQRLLEQLAQELWGREQHQIHYRELERLLHSLPAAQRDHLDPARLDLELRTAAFLTRSADGYYRFSHKSFREYFYARCLLRAVKNSDAQPLAAVLDTADLTPECVGFLADLLEEADRPALAAAVQAVLAAAYRPRSSENALRLAYFLARLQAAGQQPARPSLLNTVELSLGVSSPRQGMPGSMAMDGAQRRPVTSLPLDFGSAAAAVGIPCRNDGFEASLNSTALTSPLAQAMAAYLPAQAQLQGAKLAEMDLSGAWLRGACLQGADLQGINLADTDAEEADFSDANLSKGILRNGHFQAAVFDKAQLMDADVQDGNFAGGSFRDADLSYARFMRTNLSGADFLRTRCCAARFAAANLAGARWAEADGAFATAPGASGEVGPLLTKPPPSLVCALQPGHIGSVTCVAFSPDGQRLATGSYDNTATLWNADSGQRLRLLQGHSNRVSSVAFSPDGRQLATGSWDNTAALWDTDSGQCLRLLQGNDNAVSSVAFSPDGRRLATGSYDNTAALWNADTGQRLRLLQSHEGVVSSLAFSPDGRRLATGSYDNTVALWDAGSGQRLRLLQGHTNPVTSVAFSPDGRHLATSSDDHTAALWDADTGQRLRLLQRHEGVVSSVAFSPDGRRLATGSWDNTAALWDADSGQRLRLWQGQEWLVNSVAFSPDGRRLATGSWDNTVILWDVETGERLALLLSSPQGWLLLDRHNRWQGEGEALQWLALVDADTPAPRPTLWYAVDLPQLRRPPGEPLLPR